MAIQTDALGKRLSRIVQVVFCVLRIVAVECFRMPFTNKALVWIWLVVLGVFALSASGAIVGENVLWLFFGGLVTPAIILMLVTARRRFRQPR